MLKLLIIIVIDRTRVLGEVGRIFFRRIVLGPKEGLNRFCSPVSLLLDKILFVPFRSYHHPRPSDQQVEECVSSLLFHITKSLHAGSIRSCNFSVPFRFDVFRFLFGDCTTFNLVDFRSRLFPSNWFIVFDKHCNGCRVEFPLTMTCKLRYGPNCYDSLGIVKPRLFVETVFVKLCKKRC